MINQMCEMRVKSGNFSDFMIQCMAMSFTKLSKEKERFGRWRIGEGNKNCKRITFFDSVTYITFSSYMNPT